MGCKSVFFFYGCLKLQSPDVEVNPSPRAMPQCCRAMFFNINCLHGNSHELALAATKFAETKVTGRRHVSELLFAWFQSSNSAVEGYCPKWARCGDVFSFWSFCFAAGKIRVFLLVAKVPGQRLNCYLFVVYRSPSTDDGVFDCL